MMEFKKFLNGTNMSYEFKDIHVADVEKSINLKIKAPADGKNNLPREDSEVFSVTENEAIVAFDNHNQLKIKL